MIEAHRSKFVVHPGNTKMYQDLKSQYWWEEWKWDKIMMDIVTRLPLTPSKHDIVQEIVDRLTKSAHFIPIRKDYKVSRLAQLYVGNILQLHGLPPSIVFDRDPRITSSTTEKIKDIQERLKVVQSRQKSYADLHRREVEFEVGDYVFLKVTSMHGVMRIRVKGKLAPRYIVPFEVIERVGKVAYRLNLPARLGYVHNVFHESMLMKYTPDPSHIIEYEAIPFQENVSYEEQSI
ncbi:uncharacterized protein LOC133785346 [Humulus lupulus]|uniref:uncharacterized protein LOC133785346 n=1 Tax=Humulus lupulus TaxID=3486 RepID=UPI002B413F4B|nr:uncharacterized protein LOC133785346 [Humulus lupulus]